MGIYDQQVVRMRGFWYPQTAEKGILAAYPDLKSCCLSSPAKRGQQILVKGEVGSLPPQKVVTVEGIFKIAPLYDEEGKLIQFYVLEEAKEVFSFHFPFVSLMLGGPVFVLLFCWIKRKALVKLQGNAMNFLGEFLI